MEANFTKLNLVHFGFVFVVFFSWWFFLRLSSAFLLAHIPLHWHIYSYIFWLPLYVSFCVHLTSTHDLARMLDRYTIQWANNSKTIRQLEIKIAINHVVSLALGAVFWLHGKKLCSLETKPKTLLYYPKPKKNKKILSPLRPSLFYLEEIISQMCFIYCICLLLFCCFNFPLNFIFNLSWLYLYFSFVAFLIWYE